MNFLMSLALGSILVIGGCKSKESVAPSSIEAQSFSGGDDVTKYLHSEKEGVTLSFSKQDSGASITWPVGPGAHSSFVGELGPGFDPGFDRTHFTLKYPARCYFFYLRNLSDTQIEVTLRGQESCISLEAVNEAKAAKAGIGIYNLNGSLPEHKYAEEFTKPETAAICIGRPNDNDLTLRYFVDKGFDGPSVHHEPHITGLPAKPRKRTEGQERIVEFDLLRGSLVHVSGPGGQNAKILTIRLVTSLNAVGSKYANQVEIDTDTGTRKWSNCRFGEAYNIINGWQRD